MRSPFAAPPGWHGFEFRCQCGRCSGMRGSALASLLVGFSFIAFVGAVWQLIDFLTGA